MTFTLEQVLQLIVVLAGGGTSLLLAVRYVLGKMDTLEERVRGQLAAAIAARVEQISELHRRADLVVKDLGDHREHVARTYATVELMRDVERRITEALTATEARISAQLARLDRRLDSGRAPSGAGE